MRALVYAVSLGSACGLVAYLLLGYVAPELAPASYLNVVGLVAVVGAAAGSFLAKRRSAATDD